MFELYNHLGFNSPFYHVKNGEFIFSSSFPKAVEEYQKKLYIDKTAILQLLNRNFIFADRMIVSGIFRSPWMAKPDQTNKKWSYADLPNHYKNQDSPKRIAEKLLTLLEEEVYGYISKRQNIGILLSGGMDSRIVAGVIKRLEDQRRITNKNIVALTWGERDSRDVIYAKTIANHFKWDWKHYIVGPDELKRNFEETAINGCEYSPIHLHAIPQIRDDNELGCVVAGSFGDSIGRAEFSGTHVKELVPLNKNLRNIGQILKKKILRPSIIKSKKEIEYYHKLFPRKEGYQQLELEYQQHYMRRMLNPCMQLLEANSKFFQVFSAPEVFGFMWSLAPELRNDDIYWNLLNDLDPKLKEIPWARTGKIYGSSYGESDQYRKRHHRYKDILNIELYDYVSDLILSNRISNLGIFQMGPLETLLKLVHANKHTNIYFEERLAWIASLALLIEYYNVSSCFEGESYKNELLARKLTKAEFILRNPRSIF